MLESIVAAAIHAVQALSVHVVAFGPIFPC